MALVSSDVSAGDDILATDHNGLIDDIELHTHDGADTTQVPTANLTGHDKAAHDALNIDADTLDGNDSTDFAILAYSGAKVYDAAAPVAMTDLDLSGTVGANRTLVYLKLKLDDAAGVTTYYFRTNGEADTVDVSLVGGVSQAAIVTNTHFKYLLVLTDTAGIVEWFALNARNTELYVLAYIKLL